jgi:hypothetical protein
MVYLDSHYHYSLYHCLVEIQIHMAKIVQAGKTGIRRLTS